MAEVISRRSVVYDILFDVQSGKKSAKEAEKALDGIGKSANKVEDTIKTLGKGFVAAFAAEKVISFAKEAAELADKARGVKVAFEQLNNVSLQKLREATSNTVNDLTLMQAAVRADKFKIPLEQLAGFFKFASIRAKETGQSVQFLVDSIIDGIGRKSPLILDNLGLSATRLQSEFKKTGDFAKAAGNVINVELQKASGTMQSAASASEQLSTSIENFQLAIGTLINEGFLDDFKDFLSDVIQITTDLITGQREYNEELEKTGAIIKKFTDQDAVNLIASANFLLEIQKQQAEQGRQLSEQEIQAIKDKYIAEAQAIIATTKVVEEEAAKQGEAIKELGENILFDPNLFEKQRQALLDGLKKIADLLLEPENQIVIAPQVDLTELNKLREQLLATQSEAVTFREVIKDNGAQLGQDFATIFGNLNSLAAEGSKAQMAFSFANILAANAEALALSIKAASGLTFPANIPAIISSVAAVTGLFAQVNNLVSQAKAASSSSNTATAFAEGEVDIHRRGETRGKDSIPAIIMPGESVITTEKTSRYKPFLEAIHNGNLEDLIRVNYVEPALAVNALDNTLSDSRQVDYTDKFYRQYLATGEGNVNGKRMVKILSSIDRKLTVKNERYSH